MVTGCLSLEHILNTIVDRVKVSSHEVIAPVCWDRSVKEAHVVVTLILIVEVVIIHQSVLTLSCHIGRRSAEPFPSRRRL